MRRSAITQSATIYSADARVFRRKGRWAGSRFEIFQNSRDFSKFLGSPLRKLKIYLALDRRVFAPVKSRLPLGDTSSGPWRGRRPARCRHGVFNPHTLPDIERSRGDASDYKHLWLVGTCLPSWDRARAAALASRPAAVDRRSVAAAAPLITRPTRPAGDLVRVRATLHRAMGRTAGLADDAGANCARSTRVRPG